MDQKAEMQQKIHPMPKFCKTLQKTPSGTVRENAKNLNQQNWTKSPEVQAKLAETIPGAIPDAIPEAIPGAIPGAIIPGAIIPGAIIPGAIIPGAIPETVP